jgi:polyphosphate kinase 2
MNLESQETFRAPEAPSEQLEARPEAKPTTGRKNGSPKAEGLSRKSYEKQIEKLQVELCHLQDWVRETGARVIIVCEGRDTAGKGGLVRRMTERVSPRTFRVVALSAPSEHERQKLFLQRYVEHFPAAGEVVIFDRSWYNRAGVELVMGYTPKQDVERFLQNVPRFERWLVESGVILIKLWLEVGMKEQDRRLAARINDPLKQWKLSPLDLKSYSRWYDYSRARDAMFKATDHAPAPWYVLRSDDKKRARLNGIKHVLSQIPYKRIKRNKIELPKRSAKNRYKDGLNFRNLKLVPEIY